jgi:hypothetical protein
MLYIELIKDIMILACILIETMAQCVRTVLGMIKFIIYIHISRELASGGFKTTHTWSICRNTSPYTCKNS